MKTLEQLFGWLLFSLSILMVYGLLSLFLIGPTHARDIPPPSEFNWVDSIFALPEPTFAQMEWSWAQSCNNPNTEFGCEGQAQEDSVTVHATENKNLEQCIAHPERPVCLRNKPKSRHGRPSNK